MRNRRAVLHIEQEIAPGVADLSGEQPDRVDFGLVGRTGKTGELGRIRTLQIGPVALRFEAEHPGRALPPIASLAARGGTARGMAPFGSNDQVRIPAVMAPCATIVAADVE